LIGAGAPVYARRIVRDQGNMETHERTRLVQVVRGRPYTFGLPMWTAVALAPAAVAIWAASGDAIHLGGLVMVLLGVSAANPRFSPINGWLAWVPIIGASVVAWTRPDLGVPLAIWGAVAWVVGSIETRLTMRPYHAPGDAAPGER
jgi:hypothetical protein